MQKISRSQLTKKYNIARWAWESRHDDLLDYLNDFFSIKEIKEKTRYYYEVPDELPDTIPPLPRKNNKQEKIEDYEQYVINNLPEKPAPLSKSKMARDAINDFGNEKYGHYSYKSVANIYVGPAMEKHGEHGMKMVWVDINTYLPLTEEQEEFLHECFRQVHLSELEMANAFKKYAQEQDISEEIDNFNKAISMFRMRFAFRPISVYEWQKR